DRPRRLCARALARRCALPAGGSRSVSAASGARLDRRDPRATSGRAHLHVLGLSAERVRPQRRPAARSLAARPAGRAAAEGGRGRCRLPRPRTVERPRAGLDRSGGWLTRPASRSSFVVRQGVMLELYYAPNTCALATHIALEETGADYA